MSLAKYSFLIAKFMIFITVKNRNKTCSKIKKTWDLLVTRKKSKGSRQKAFCKKFTEHAGKIPELGYLFNLIHYRKIQKKLFKIFL